MLLFLLSISDERDHEKIVYLYNTYHSDMMRFAKYRLKKAGMPNYSNDAEDAVQSAFLKIVKYISSVNFDANYQELKSYVFSIVSNETVNIIADYKYFEDIDEYLDEFPDSDFFNQMQINEKYEQVVKVIEKMDDKYSTVLLFRYRDDMSVKAIADLLGIAEKTVYGRLEKGKRLLLELLREDH